MERQHIDITQDLEGERVVHAVFDLREDEIAASAHAVSAAIAERFRNHELSADDVIEFRELTALADELRELTGGAPRSPAGAGQGARGTIVMRPARLNAYLHALAMFVESRDEAEWIRDEDREALAVARALLWPLEDLAAEAIQAALTGRAPRHA
jgi:hypothetical protein